MQTFFHLKLIYLTLLFFVFCLPLANAQFDGGTWYFGANTSIVNLTGSFHSTTEGHEPDIRNIVINLEPSVGVFIINRLLLSVNADFRYADLRSSDDWKMTANAYSIGPALTFYIGHGWFRPYVSAGTSFGMLTSKIRGSLENSDEKFSLVDYQGKAGLAIFPTENFSVNTGFRFQRFTFSESKPSANNISVFVGIGFYL